MIITNNFFKIKTNRLIIYLVELKTLVIKINKCKPSTKKKPSSIVKQISMSLMKSTVFLHFLKQANRVSKATQDHASKIYIMERRELIIGLVSKTLNFHSLTQKNHPILP